MNGQVVQLNRMESYIMVLPLILNQKKVGLYADRNHNLRIPRSQIITRRINNSEATKVAANVANGYHKSKNLQFCYKLVVQSENGVVQEIYFFVCELVKRKKDPKKISMCATHFMNKVETLDELSKILRASLIKRIKNPANNKQTA